MHVLIVGMTEAGKTSLGRGLVSRYAASSVNSLVLDPLGDHWPTKHTFLDPGLFIDTARRSRSCALFIDEAGETVGRYDEENHWLATRSRHYGHAAHFLCQRLPQVAPTVRDQCGALALFRVSFEDARQLAVEWARPELLEAAGQTQGQFLWVTRFGELSRLALEFPWATPGLDRGRNGDVTLAG